MQSYNPYLPSFEYVPDGEPHVFEGRVYLYGSHDRFGGEQFCLNDYICYSADVNDLTDWKYEGIIYRKEQDPRNQNIPADAVVLPAGHGAVTHKGGSLLNGPGIHAMWAPDVVRGPDGRFYLYYCLDFLNEIGVAVCSEPAGKYEFYGFVKHQDGSVLGQRKGDYIQFDPGIFVDDDGSIYLYSGNSPRDKGTGQTEKKSQVMKLCRDMLTLQTEPEAFMPDIDEGEGTEFAGHEFFEASSIRKINGKYYFVYSSVQSHELCYCISDKPDRDYRFGGTIVDIGDIFLDGRTEEESLNSFGNTHGGIECCAGQWYIFYHRQTNCTQYSRQACAQPIFFDKDGRIAQVEVTSCGFNKNPLDPSEIIPAYTACHLRRNGRTVMSLPSLQKDYPYFTQDREDTEPDKALIAEDRIMPIQYITNIRSGCETGFKYINIDHSGDHVIRFMLRGNASGNLKIYAAGKTGTRVIAEEALKSKEAGNAVFIINSCDWQQVDGTFTADAGVYAFYFVYSGEGSFDMNSFNIQ